MKIDERYDLSKIDTRYDLIELLDELKFEFELKYKNKGFSIHEADKTCKRHITFIDDKGEEFTGFSPWYGSWGSACLFSTINVINAMIDKNVKKVLIDEVYYKKITKEMK
jgi:hypothetical protein